MTDRWCKHCDGWGWILHPYGRPAEKCNCGGPYRGGASNEVSDTLACDEAISAARELMRQHDERRRDAVQDRG